MNPDIYSDSKNFQQEEKLISTLITEDECGDQVETKLSPAQLRQWQELKPTKLRVLLFINSIFWYFNDEISDLLVIIQYYHDGKYM